ncbi:MAG: acyltransferase [Rhodocyclales bacterium]|nr:acyltransferase [Rhodocyclales bacterium]
MDNHTSRLPVVDALKAIASQLIVLHHLALYGPMSDIAYDLVPGLIEWLANHARIAVQVFLVVGGFLSARSLAALGSHAIGLPLLLVWKRYCRLAIPFMMAMLLAVACAAVARALLPLDSTPAAPGLLQLIAHLLLIQNLLDFEALSAGVWYVAIDFQLYSLMVALLWLAGIGGTAGHRRLAIVLVSGLGIASLLYFNRITAWDDWGLYFFGAYALGALAFWASESKLPLVWLALTTAGVVAALLLDFRSRIVVALFAAVLLGLTLQTRRPLHPAAARQLSFLGDISYSVFLVHYPVSLVFNALFGRLAPESPGLNVLGLLLAWGACIPAGTLFHRQVELPAMAWLSRHSTLRLAGKANTAR